MRHLFIPVLIYALAACTTTQAAPPVATTIYVAVLVIAKDNHIVDMEVAGASETQAKCESAAASVLANAGAPPQGVSVVLVCKPVDLPYVPIKPEPQTKTKVAPGETEL
jgi:hypothetical protein